MLRHLFLPNLSSLLLKFRLLPHHFSYFRELLKWNSRLQLLHYSPFAGCIHFEVPDWLTSCFQQVLLQIFGYLSDVNKLHDLHQHWLYAFHLSKMKDFSLLLHELLEKREVQSLV
ncbi:unnamed protein product [Brugia timori]|uniref:Ovule protein n=1 Tax=Brugia timori TaxID=42155 RepID=A0A0R3Q5L1_9BILA|nr:unnamed protein product [Brugia timori]